MTISRVEIQGQVTRAQDFTTIKHNEDNKGMVDQSNFQRQFDQSVENKVRQVHQGDRSENQGKNMTPRKRETEAMREMADANGKKPGGWKGRSQK